MSPRLASFPSELNFDFFVSVPTLVFDVNDFIRRNVDALAGDLDAELVPQFDRVRQPPKFLDELLDGIGLLNVSRAILCLS